MAAPSKGIAAMMRNRYLGAVAIAAALAVGPFAGAIASPVDFTWSPSALGAAYSGDGNIVNANNYNVSNFNAISVNTTTGAFTGNGYLNILNFLNGGATVSATGLGTNYSLYLAFTEAGTQTPIPTTPGGVATGTFSSLSYSLIATPNGAPPVSFLASGGIATHTDPGPDITLATGSLVPGTGFITLTDTASGLSPTANMNLTFVENPAESAFFLAPLTGLDLQIGNFSATGSVTTLTGGNPSIIDINGGGGNLTFQTAAVPEPASLAVLGAGLLGLARVARRRRKA